MRTKIPSLDRRDASYKQKHFNYAAELSDNESMIGSFFNAGNKCTAVVEFKPDLTH